MYVSDCQTLMIQVGVPESETSGRGCECSFVYCLLKLKPQCCQLTWFCCGVVCGVAQNRK